MDETERIRAAFEARIYRVEHHAVQRLVLRGISLRRLRTAILANGEVIEQRLDDQRGPMCLVRCEWANDVYHALCTVDPVRLITAYRPDADHFIPPDFRRRRR